MITADNESVIAVDGAKEHSIKTASDPSEECGKMEESFDDSNLMDQDTLDYSMAMLSLEVNAEVRLKLRISANE